VQEGDIVARTYAELDERLRKFIVAQPIFPVAARLTRVRPHPRVGRMRIALLNSGLGLLAAAARLHELRPDADLVLSMDPDGMPWGARTPGDIAQRSLSCARAAAAYQPDVLVFACNTGSVHALGALRAEFEPGIPVVGTVPAIKPAAAASDAIAIWATAATTGSAYQRQLITEFAAAVHVTEIACPGLADAIHAGDDAATSAAISAAAARTPAECGAIVLGCTEYELAAANIAAALPGVALFGSAAAVAAQALRRAGATGNGSGQAQGPSPADTVMGATPATPRMSPATPGMGAGPAASPDAGTGSLQVLLSGRPSRLPPAALGYPEGRLLAALPAGPPAGQFRAVSRLIDIP
jgi:glutamate racemase